MKSIREGALLFGVLAFALAAAPVQISAGGKEDADPLEDLPVQAQQQQVYQPTDQPGDNAPPALGVVDVFTRLNVRDAAGMRGGIIGKLSPGDRVRIFGEKDGWYEIGWRGRRAWVSKHYVRKRGEPFRNELVSRPEWPGASPEERPRPETPPAGLAVRQIPAVNANPAGVPEASRAAAAGGAVSLKVPLYGQMRVGGKYPRGYCGPTALLMAAEFFGIRKHADYLALTRAGPGTPMYRPGAGSTHQGIATMARHIGLRGTTLSYGVSLAWLRRQVASGRPVITGVKGAYAPGKNSAGHVVVVSGFTAQGDVILSDPGDGRRRVVPVRQFYAAWSYASGGRMAIVVSP